MKMESLSVTMATLTPQKGLNVGWRLLQSVSICLEPSPRARTGQVYRMLSDILNYFFFCPFYKYAR